MVGPLGMHHPVTPVFCQLELLEHATKWRSLVMPLLRGPDTLQWRSWSCHWSSVVNHGLSSPVA